MLPSSHQARVSHQQLANISFLRSIRMRSSGSADPMRHDMAPGVARLAVKAGEPPSPVAMRQQWQKWVAVRDAHCAGHPWRYSKHQLAYHYTQGDRRAWVSGCPGSGYQLLVPLLQATGPMRMRHLSGSASSSLKCHLPEAHQLHGAISLHACMSVICVHVGAS